MPAHPTLYLKKELYDTYGNFNTNYNIAADYEFILRLFKQKELTIKELPLCFMDVSLKDYSNLEQAQEDLVALLNITKQYNGNFVCLWHNSSFDSYEWDRYVSMYNLIVSFE